MKVMTIAGTRPDLIKLSEIIKKLDTHAEHVFVHTGQNYDPNLHDVFFEDLGIRKPDYNLGVASETLGKTLANVMTETENVIQAENPDAVVILGDTNSALASIIVKRKKIPLFHLEAGNRSFDDNVPEEVNRRLIDHISDVNLVFSENARRNLISEGLPKDRIFLMGSPIKEVLNEQAKKIKKSKILRKLGLKKGKYYLASIHREENLDIPANFIQLFTALNVLAEVTNSEIILSTHPRTRKKFKEANIKLDNVTICEPFGFSDWCKLQQSARCVISDSGTIAEESAILGFPAITVRNAIERPEAIDAGSITLAGTKTDDIIRLVDLAQKPTMIPNEYQIDNCSDRVVKIILGYTNYVSRYVWHL